MDGLHHACSHPNMVHPSAWWSPVFLSAGRNWVELLVLPSSSLSSTDICRRQLKTNRFVILSLTRPQSSLPNALVESRGWWEGKREEDSRTRFPHSNHTHRATKEKERERDDWGRVRFFQISSPVVMFLFRKYNICLIPERCLSSPILVMQSILVTYPRKTLSDRLTRNAWAWRNNKLI